MLTVEIGWAYIMKWLFITNEIPWPLNHGTWLRVYHISRQLRKMGQEVSILSYEGNGTGVEKYNSLGIRLISGPKGQPPRRGKSRCWGGPYAYDAVFGRQIEQEAAANDIAVLVRPYMLQYSKEASRSVHVVADMVDDPILEERRKFWYERKPVEWLRRLRFLVGEYRCEQAFRSWIHHFIFVSSQDAESYSRRHRRSRVICIPNGVDAEYFSCPGMASRPEHPVVMFLGNLIHPPNEDAALYLIQEIAPLIWKSIPETRFTIVGSNPSKQLRGLVGPMVKVTGEVNDVRPMLWESTMALFPMRRGTGIKNKLLEAWAAGVPVVTTPMACQGVPARDGDNLLLGKAPAELASKAVQLIRDHSLQDRLAQQGRQTIEKYLTWELATQRFMELIQKN
jgi:glycosyltransferase involved in cell wall biosynthesis